MAKQSRATERAIALAKKYSDFDGPNPNGRSLLNAIQRVRAFERMKFKVMWEGEKNNKHPHMTTNGRSFTSEKSFLAFAASKRLRGLEVWLYQKGEEGWIKYGGQANEGAKPPEEILHSGIRG